MNLDTLTLENYVFYIGSVGLILALCWVLFRKKKPAPKSRLGDISPQSPAPTAAAPAAPASPWWNALSKSRDKFLARLSGLNVDELKSVLEESCITSDLGVGNTDEALNRIHWAELAKLPDSERVQRAKESLSETFLGWLSNSPLEQSENWPEKKNSSGPTVIWFVGVNGVGKTTTIAKVASELKNKNHKVLLAAGDTFRAAAGEQLEEWAQRLGIECVRGSTGADSSAVLFDAIQSGAAKGMDFVLCDSAGRLHTQSQLMEALEKNKRVMNKALAGAPHEVVLVLDANTGQNMLTQAEQFLKSVGVNGLILTKLDGSARGGAIVAIARKIALPIYRLGLGEKADDMRAFDPRAFAAALLGLETLKEKVPSLAGMQGEKTRNL